MEKHNLPESIMTLYGLEIERIAEDYAQQQVKSNDLSPDVSNCPFCSEQMKGIKLTHYKCKNCNEYFTD